MCSQQVLEPLVYDKGDMSGGEPSGRGYRCWWPGSHLSGSQRMQVESEDKDVSLPSLIVFYSQALATCVLFCFVFLNLT